MNCGNSSVGRAQPCQGWGREFESRFPLHVERLHYRQCPGGGIGRRARFRCVCREACRFESCSGHPSFAEGKICGNSSVGRAQPCQGWGREFESRFPLRLKSELCQRKDVAPISFYNAQESHSRITAHGLYKPSESNLRLSSRTYRRKTYWETPNIPISL